MAQFLKQSTASQEILLGPFVDSTDGSTAETALTIANTDIKIWKTGATTLANKNSGGATHISSGNYYAVLDATDTDTLGPLEVIVQVTGALPVRREYQVLPAWQYDSLFTANGPAPALGLIDIGTAQSATGTTLVLRSGITVTDDVMIGATIYVYSSTNGLHERRIITDWVSATDTATVDAWTQTPTGTILYAVYATPPASTIAVAADVTKWNGTAVATPDTAGYPKVTIKDGTGAGEIALTSGAVDTVTAVTNTVNANMTQISGDSVAADNLEAALDGTGGVTITAGVTGNVTGNLSGSVGSVTGAVGSVASGGITAASIADDAIDAASLASDVYTNLNMLRKNTAFNNFMFKMVDATDGFTAETGITVTATRSLDGAAFAACANAVTEVSNGWYKINLATTDTNGNVIVLRFTGTGCRDTEIVVIPQPTAV